MKSRDLTRYFFISVIVLMVLVTYSMTAARYLPEGINSYFLERLLKRLIIPVPFLVFLGGLYVFFIKKGHFLYQKEIERLQLSDLAFPLIPMVPIIRYIFANQEMLTLPQSFFLILIFLIASIVICSLMPAFLSFLVPKFVMITASTSLLFSVFNMASLPAGMGLQQHPSLFSQMSILGLVFIILLASWLIPLKIRTYIIVFFLFAIISIFVAVDGKPQPFKERNFNSLPVFEAVKGKKIRKKNDILLIVYESYVNDGMLQHYGFDNSTQRKFLEDHGFHIYDGVYSLANASISSMSAVLNLDSNMAPHRKNVTGGAVQKILKSNGYTIYYVFYNDYFFRGLKFEQVLCDIPFPQIFREEKIGKETRLMIDAILKGDFSDRISLDGGDYTDFLKQKRRVIAEAEKKPLFMYSHNKYPGHGPSRNGMALEERGKYINKYMADLLTANKEMRQDVEEIIFTNPDSIVILAGDHGPFLTKTGFGMKSGRGNFDAKDVDRYDIQDRFGTFLAIRWPEKAYAEKHDIRILQDVFPAVFAYIYEDDSLFDKTRADRATEPSKFILGVYVKDGIIIGGQDDGKGLFD